MEPESPSLLHRIRWGNVAWALAAVVAVGLVVAWPHIQRRGPGLPDEAASVPRDPAPRAVPPAPAAPAVPAARPAPRTAAPPAVRPRRSTHRRRGAAKPRPRPARRRPRPAPAAAPVPVPAPGGGSGGGSSAPQEGGPAAPAGDQEFLPG